MAHRKSHFEPQKLRGIVQTSSKLDTFARSRARDLNNYARAVFIARQITSNEYRTSETTPPKYVRSFKVERINAAKTRKWAAKNTDPGAVWVEYGAHAGGRTLVLRYYPYHAALRALGTVK